HELPEMVDFAADHGAESLHVRHLVSYGDSDSSYKKEAAYRELFNNKAERARRAAVTRGIDLFLPDRVHQPSVASKSCEPDGRRIRRMEANPYCLLPWFQAIISWDGDYRIC